MFDRQLSLAALIALGVSAPTLATAAAAQPAAARPAGARPAAAAAPAQTRVGLANSLQANFKSIDLNGDGMLSTSELQAAEAKVLGQRVAAVRGRIDAEFTKLDTNKDGQLSKAEFMAAAPSAPARSADGAALLTQLDKNKDGKVTVDEYRNPILARFDSVDTNKDGTLSPAERAAAQARVAK